MVRGRACGALLCVVALTTASAASGVWESQPAGASAVAAPPTPTGLTAKTASASKVNLVWKAVTGAASYRVFRAASASGTFTRIGSPKTASFASTGLAALTTYYFAVQSVSKTGVASQPSGEVSATTLPATPAGLTAKGVSATQINLTWGGVKGAVSYRVLRATVSGGPYTRVGLPTTSTFADSGLSVGTTFYYVVQALTSTGIASARSVEVSAPTFPAAPTGVNATPASSSEIDLTWNAATSATSYTVERATTSGGPYSTVGSPTATAFADKGLTPNTTYFYVVAAVDSSGTSTVSAEVSALTAPSSPSGLAATAASKSQIDLTWSAVAGATSYTVQQATASSGPYTTVGSPTTTSFSDTNLS